MELAGIICECDPPHAGHAYLLDTAKQSSDAVVCLMSGPFCQRGTAAVLDKHARAQMLLSMGADLVLEHMFPFAAAGTEVFADSGVAALSGIGATSLWFGSECGDLQKLIRAAEITATESFRSAYADACKRSDRGTAAVYFDLLASFVGPDAPVGSNDTLGVSYLKAISAQKAEMIPHTVKRTGSAFDAIDLPASGTPSATALRRLLLDGETERVLPYLPNDTCREILRRELDAGRAPVSLSRADAAILGSLRLSDINTFCRCAELEGGLGERILKAAREATSYADLLSRVATKKYPDARIRRGILFGLLGVTEIDLAAKPAYLGLLGCSETGRKVLAQLRRRRTIPVVSAKSSIPKTSASTAAWEIECRAAALVSLCYPTPVSEADLLRRWFSDQKTVDKRPEV